MFDRSITRRSPATILRVALVASLFVLAGTIAIGAKVVGSSQVSLPAHTIIPNIDDDDGDGRPDHKADSLNGAAENELLRVRIASGGALPEGTVIRPNVPPAWMRSLRILRLDPAGDLFRPVTGALKLTPEECRGGGADIAIEAGDFAGKDRSRQFEIVFRFETPEGRPIMEKTLAVEAAPFLMSSCLDPAETVHVVRTGLTGRFVDELKPLVEAAGAKLLAFEEPKLPEHDIWIQDATEIGSAGDGRRAIRVALHGNRGHELDGLFAASFLGRDAAVVHSGSFRGRPAEWIDWYGNLEVSPPVTASGREYPHGRIYAGKQGARAMHPEVIAFLEAQGAQAPVLWLDTSWLVIGHVDEAVSWIPSDVGRPFRMLVPSPRLALEILRDAEKAAPGGILNRGTRRPDSEKGEYLDAPVATILKDPKVLADQAFVQGKVDEVRRTLQTELGIADADIVEVPVLFETWPGRFEGRYGALTVNMVNSLQVGKTLIVPDPHGPLVDGKDVLLGAVKDRLEPLGCKIVAIDDFYPYHRYGGEVHCGTNATRRRVTPR